jgi:recombinational DNA repair protein RecR
MTPEAKAFAAVTRAIEDLPVAAQRRVLRHAEESCGDDLNIIELTTKVMKMLTQVLDAVRSAVVTCEHCGASRLVDGKPCPVCFPLWEILPEAENRAKLLRGEMMESRS